MANLVGRRAGPAGDGNCRASEHLNQEVAEALIEADRVRLKPASPIGGFLKVHVVLERPDQMAAAAESGPGGSDAGAVSWPKAIRICLNRNWPSVCKELSASNGIGRCMVPVG